MTHFVIRNINVSYCAILYMIYQIEAVVQVCVTVLTVSSEAAARRSGRKPTSRRCSRKLWSSMP